MIQTNKSIEDSFRDWEADTFGFGYGTGEQHIIPALRRFLELCCGGRHNRVYDYNELEQELTPTVAWLLINILCSTKVDMIEYGVSTRYAWLTAKGERLKEFMLSRSNEELVAIITSRTDGYLPCCRDACNCGPSS